MSSLDEVSHYDYELSPDRIASEPLPERDASRLLCLERRTGAIAHRTFRQFPGLLRPGDLLVVNETKVVPARLVGQRTATGGKWEGLFLGVMPEGHWRLIGQTRGKLQPGESITLQHASGGASPATLQLTLRTRTETGEWTAIVDSQEDTFCLLEQFGTVPLPPYLQREQPSSLDRERYQTTFAKLPGAVAAPTAGLHFTPEILEACRRRGAEIVPVTLHVGLGTFRPMDVNQLSEHRMHSEWCDLPQPTVDAIYRTRRSGGRVIGIGTTTVRTLESVAASGPLRAWSGETSLFIRPPYEFRVVDALLTNFHLPRSTLLVLVSAFAGREQVLNAYHTAIAEQYRFYSYGDAMFIADSADDEIP